MPRSVREPYPDGRASRLYVRARCAWAIAAVITVFGLASLGGSGGSVTKVYVGALVIAGTIAAVGGLLQRSATRKGTGPIRTPPRPVPGPPRSASPDPDRSPATVGDRPDPDPAPPGPAPAAPLVQSVRPELLPRAAVEQQWDPILAEKW